MDRELSPLSFQYVAPELRVFHGRDSLQQLVRELKRNNCKRAVVVCGKTLAASPAMDGLREVLGTTFAGISATARSNSPLPDVEATMRALEEMAADGVIAIGGGSAVVTARAASILLAEKKPAQALCTRKLPNGQFDSPRLAADKLPQFVIPTTPSTAFVKAGSAVHDPNDGLRLALFDPKTRAKALFIHPAFLATAPASLVQSAGLNTLASAIEALESPRCDLVSEAWLLQAVRLAAANIRRADEPGTRERLVLAGILCGRGTDQVGGGLCSVLAHAIGHRCHVANGLVNALVLPHTMRFNAASASQDYGRIADALRPAGEAQSSSSPGFEQAVQRVEALFGKISIPRRLHDIGLTRGDLPSVAEAAMSDWFISKNPRRVNDVKDVLEVIEAAF